MIVSPGVRRGGGNTPLKAVARLFYAGEQGAWYDPSDLSSMYQESSGITPAVVGQPDGLWLDKRIGLARGAELVTNGDLATGDTTGWGQGDAASTLSVVSGKLRITNGDASAAYSTATGVVPSVGKTYELIYTLSTAPSIGGGRLLFGGYDSGSVLVAGTYRRIVIASTAGQFTLTNGSDATLNDFSEWDNISVRLIDGNHALQATSPARPVPTAYGSYTGLLFDAIDDNLTCATGGGGTAGFFWCGAVKVVGGDLTTRTLWSDAGTNSGYRIRINAANNLELAAGNGVAFTTIATAGALAVGGTYVLTAWDDGINLNAQINQGAISQVARPVVTAGTAGYTLCKDNGAATSFANVAIFAHIYRKIVPNASQIAAVQRYCAGKAGVVL